MLVASGLRGDRRAEYAAQSGAGFRRRTAPRTCARPSGSAVSRSCRARTTAAPRRGASPGRPALSGARAAWRSRRPRSSEAPALRVPARRVERVVREHAEGTRAGVHGRAPAGRGGPAPDRGERSRAALRPQAREDGAVDFLDEHGACVIRYGELHVWDARGRGVADRSSSSHGNSVAILIDDRRTRTYPLTVDPLDDFAGVDGGERSSGLLTSASRWRRQGT